MLVKFAGPGDGEDARRWRDRLARGVRPRVSETDAAAVRWLDAFGGLTANNDRHDGNVSFFRDAKGALSLAPAYDTAPMALAPVAAGVLDRAWQPELPAPSAVEEWKAAVPSALVFWERVDGEARLDLTVRRRAREARAAVERLAESRFPGLRAGPRGIR